MDGLEIGIILKCIAAVVFASVVYPVGLYDWLLPYKLKSKKGKAKVTIVKSAFLVDGKECYIDLPRAAVLYDQAAMEAETEGRIDEAATMRLEADQIRSELQERYGLASRQLKRNWIFAGIGIGAYVLLLWGLAELL